MKSRSSDSLARVSSDRSITLVARNVYIEGERDAGFVAITLPLLLLSWLFVFHFLGPSRLFPLCSFSLRVLFLAKRNLRRL